MNTVFLLTRVVHILFAALWLGTVVFITRFIMPVVQDMGPDGGKVMLGLQKRGMITYIPVIAGVTMLTGIYLYWHLTSGFDPSQSATTSAKVFGAGGVLGIVAGILGGAIVGRAAKQAGDLIAKMPSMPEKDRGAAAAELHRLRDRMKTYGAVVLALLLVTITLMALGHYV